MRIINKTSKKNPHIYKNGLEVNYKQKTIEDKMLEARWKIVGIKHTETSWILLCVSFYVPW